MTTILRTVFPMVVYSIVISMRQLHSTRHRYRPLVIWPIKLKKLAKFGDKSMARDKKKMKMRIKISLWWRSNDTELDSDSPKPMLASVLAHSTIETFHRPQFAGQFFTTESFVGQVDQTYRKPRKSKFLYFGFPYFEFQNGQKFLKKHNGHCNDW